MFTTVKARHGRCTQSGLPPTGRAARCVEGQYCLDSHIHSRDVESLKHNLQSKPKSYIRDVTSLGKNGQESAPCRWARNTALPLWLRAEGMDGALSVQGGGGAVHTGEGWGYAGGSPGSHETLEIFPAYQLTAAGFLPGVSTVHGGVWTRRAAV